MEMIPAALLGIDQQLKLNAAAMADSIRAVGRHFGVPLPDDYVEFISVADGGEGPIGQSSYLRLWPVSDIPLQWAGYEFDTYAPLLIPFGTDGGGLAFAFDSRRLPMTVVEVDLSDLSGDDAIQVAPSFLEFLKRIP